MKRTIAVAAIALGLLAGGSAHAEASTKHVANARTLKCERALKWADRKHTEARADKAVIVCTRLVTSQSQAGVLYRWAADQSAYVRDLIG